MEVICDECFQFCVIGWQAFEEMVERLFEEAESTISFVEENLALHEQPEALDQIETKTSANFLTAHIDDQALEVFKKESYEGKRRILKRLLKWDRPLRFDLPGFDQSYYLNNNKDVEKSGVDPMKHFLRHGWKEGRNPSAAFNMSGYLQANPDVKKSGLNALLHFLEYGRKEGRHGWNNY